ncbi:MAG: cell division protein ZapA [Candidatus Zixiibacteriota bacterium]|nr:MAG: cell division protein ZapA [candidate division Zixibacteria bacterium]
MADSSAASKVVVNIYGEDYPITGAGDPSYISRIADYVDAKMKETAKTSRVASRDKVAILAAMSIASELHAEKATLRQSGKQFDHRIDAILKRLDAALKDLP